MQWIPGAPDQASIKDRIDEFYVKIPTVDLEFFQGQWCNYYSTSADIYMSGGQLESIDRTGHVAKLNRFGKKTDITLAHHDFYFKKTSPMYRGYTELTKMRRVYTMMTSQTAKSGTAKSTKRSDKHSAKSANKPNLTIEK